MRTKNQSWPARGALSKWLLIGLTVFSLLLAGQWWLGPEAAQGAASRPAASGLENGAAGVSLLLSFIPNRGQVADTTVRFTVKNQGHAIFFTPAAVVFKFAHLTESGAAAEAVRLRFLGANPAPAIEGAAQLPGVVNILRGADPAGWHTGLPTYGAIVYRELYPGIDLRYSGHSGALKSEFVVVPQAEPARIRLVYDGVNGMRLRQDGALVLDTAYGQLVESAPVVYQEIGGRRINVEAAYRLLAGGQVGFQLGVYDSNYPLIIDPVIVYGSYLGGSTAERGNAIAIDVDKNIYAIGTTVSDDFPTANALDDSYGGGINGDAFVAKLDPSGSTLIYATYLGGSSSDLGFGIAADAAGNAYLAGQTASEDFPLNNELDDECGSVVNTVPNIGCTDGFVAKLNSAGSALLFSTYLGGNGIDAAADIVLDGENNVYLTGYTESTDFPTTAGSFQPNANFLTRGSSSDSFVVKMAPNGAALSLTYATYLGGAGFENIGSNPHPSAIAVDSQGQVVVTGQTVSDDFPTLNAAQPTYAGGDTPAVGGDAFVAKLAADGSGLLFATYLGGSDDENRAGNAGIAIDSNDNILVTGYTASDDFPAENAWQTTFGGGSSDAFVVKYNAGGAVQYATYLGGNSLEYSHGIAADSLGNSYVVGTTFSDNFPTVDNMPGQCDGGVCAFITQYNSDGSALVYSSYLGGIGGNNTAYDVVVDDERAAYVIGETNSTRFPTVSPLQSQVGGGFDAFIVKIVPAQRVYLPAILKSSGN